VERNLATAQLPELDTDRLARLKEEFTGFEKVVNVEENGSTRPVID